MLIRTQDPLDLEAFLGSRIPELREMAILRRQDLLPAPGWRSDASCRIVRKGPRVMVHRHSPLEEEFFLIEAKLEIPRLPRHVLPAIHFKCGNHSEGILFLDGAPRSGIATGIWDGGAPVFLGNLRPGRHLLNLHVERDRGFGAFRGKERATFERLDLLLVDTRLAELAIAMDLALEAGSCLDDRDPDKARIRKGLIDLYAEIPIHDRGEVFRRADRLVALLGSLLFTGRNQKDVRMGVFAHAHVDLAWLWDLDQTRRKNLRTFLTQLSLADKHPSMVFQQSQAPLFQWLREDHPAVWRKVRAAVRRGRFQAAGGTWVEPDTNLTGLESLARQMLYGKRFFKKEFNLDCRVLWLPDTFGFTRALPQLMKLAGLDLLVTTKISWSSYTRFPHDTFRWFSPDGSEALVHFITAARSDRTTNHAYNTVPTAKTVWHTWGEYANKEQNQTLLLPYGYGDGGGGAKDTMLQQVKWLQRGLRGFPKVEPLLPEEFCRRLRRSVAVADLPAWHDELYLERHRGTYTSQARIKQGNRRCEHLLKTAEKIEVLENRSPARLQAAWEELLLLQFHDILPGTSVREVNGDALARLARIEAPLQKRLDAFVRSGTRRHPGRAVVFNPHGWAFSGRVCLGDRRPHLVNLPALSKVSIPLPRRAVRRLQGHTLENDAFRLVVDPSNGAIARLRDLRRGRDVLNGPANLLELYEDRSTVPRKEAWSLEYYHLLKQVGKGMTVRSCRLSKGEGWQSCVLKGRVLHSPIQQTITLHDDSPVVCVDTEIDWREKDLVLKAAHPLNVLADRAVYGIQGCVLERPTHTDRLEDHARFEVPAQGWMDLSEGAYGVSLLADSKFGFSCRGSTARITLLRSPTSPDETADRGIHRFSCGIYPHPGDWRAANTPVVAENFAFPATGCAGITGEERRFLEVRELEPGRTDHFLVDVLKAAEEGPGIILRGHECKGSRGRARIRLPFGIFRSAWKCDLLERPLAAVALRDGHRLDLPYRPYEIITLLLLPARNRLRGPRSLHA